MIFTRQLFSMFSMNCCPPAVVFHASLLANIDLRLESVSREYRLVVSLVLGSYLITDITRPASGTFGSYCHQWFECVPGELLCFPTIIRCLLFSGAAGSLLQVKPPTGRSVLLGGMMIDPFVSLETVSSALIGPACTRRALPTRHLIPLEKLLVMSVTDVVL